MQPPNMQQTSTQQVPQTADAPLPAGTIFISFRSSRRDTANTLYNRLKSQRYRPWLDRVNLEDKIGEPFPTYIEQAVTQAAVFIVILSSDFFDSQWCKDELELAVSLKKRIIPLIIGTIRDIPIPPYLSELNLQYGLLAGKPSDDENTYQIVLKQLKAWEIERDPPPPPPPPTWIRPALLIALALTVLSMALYGVYRSIIEFNRPDPTVIIPVGDTPSDPISQRVQVKHVAVAPDQTVFYTADQPGGIHLFQFDPATNAHQDRGVLPGGFTRQLHVDCDGTVWILMQDTNAGVYTYPDTFRLDARAINNVDWNLFSPEHLAVASRCTDSTVEVWLAGNGTIHTVRYPRGESPTLDHAVPLSNSDARLFHNRITGTVNIVSLSYQTNTHSLWLTDTITRSIQSYAVDSFAEPRVIVDEQIDFSEIVAFDSDVFVLGVNGVFRVDDSANRLIELPASGANGEAASTVGANAAAQGGNAIWFANPCGINCPSIGVYYDGQLFFYKNAEFSIYDIEADRSGTVYFATSNGLYQYGG